MTSLYTLLHSIPSQGGTSAKFSPDGSRIAVSSSDGAVSVYNTSDWAKISVLKGHTRGISDVDFSPIDNNVLATCSDDLTIRLWFINEQKCFKILRKHTYHVTTVRFTSKGNVLISGSADETITIWDIKLGKTIKTLAAHADPILSLSISSDSTIIVSASYDGLMRLFDLETGQCLKTLTYNSTSHGTATASTNDVLNFPISNVELSPNDKYILSSSLDGMIRLWDYMENRVLKTYTGPDGEPISKKYNCATKFITATESPKIVSGSQSSGILLWDVQSKQLEWSAPAAEPILQVDVFDNGRRLVACGFNKVEVFELNQNYLARSRTASVEREI